jgi:small-conductance mechanosensitive channel
VRFDSFGDYSLNFKFGYNLRGYVHRFTALKSVNHELFYVFKENEINVPFPVRVIYNRNEMEGEMGGHKGKKSLKRK